MPKIWLYWTGPEYKLIKILRRLIYQHLDNVILLTPNNVKKYIKLPSNFFSLLPAHQADYVRVNIIYKYGGIWLDSDTIVMDKLDTLFDLFKTKNGFFIKEDNKYIINGVFGSKPRTKLMYQWKNYIDNVVKQKTIKWTELGSTYLNARQTTTLFDNYQIFDGLDNMYPVSWKKCISEYIEKPYDNYKNIVRDYQPLIILVNGVYKKMEVLDEDEILNGNRPINYFINKSLSH